MKLNMKQSSLLLLLLPSIAQALVPPKAPDAATNARDTVDYTSEKRHGVPTKDAPVDGKDGKPHLGPFVETEDHKRTPTEAKAPDGNLPPLQGRPDDPTKVDGQKIPETNDGVMFDKNRQHAEDGTTGLEGGVTAKEKARKAEEDRTGEKPFTKPTAPKEQPPLPNSEEPKIPPPKDVKDTKAEPKIPPKDSSRLDYTGMGKPHDLPTRPNDQAPPVPGGSVNTASGSIPPKIVPEVHSEENIIQPLHSFVLSFTMILVSEVGDKTFLVAALMAMKHDRMVVFTAAFGALLVMTVLSAVLGHAVPTLIPKHITSFLAAGLFFVFGARLMREGLQMDPNEGVTAEMHEVEQELAEKEKELGRKRGGSVSAHTLEMGLNGRRSRTHNRLISPPRSPSQSPVRGSLADEGVIPTIINGASNLFSLILSPAWVQTFVMTFLGEWGDRSQIATIAMAAGQDYWWVTFGAMAGHAICTGVAVIGGRAIAGRVSLKVVTIGGATAFLIFGVIYLLEAIW